MAESNGALAFTDNMTIEKMAFLQTFANIFRNSSAVGQQYGGRRDLETVFGYLRSPSASTLWDYSKRGLGARIVEIWPNDTWMTRPTIQEVPEPGAITPFEQDVEAVIQRTDMWGWMQELDIMAQIGEYGVMLVGVEGVQDFTVPIGEQIAVGRGPEAIQYLRVYPQFRAEIQDLSRETSDPNFGDPSLYRVEAEQKSRLAGGTDLDVTFNVHASHVIHFADHTRGNRIFGNPLLLRVIDRIFDSEKMIGGIGEMTFRDGKRRMVVEANEGISIDDIMQDKEFKRHLEEFAHELKEWFIASGSTVKAFAGEIPDIASNYLRLMQNIAFELDVPMRRMFGSEQGSLATEQDNQSHNRKLTARMMNICEPRIIRPTIDLFIEIGAVRPPTANGGTYQVVVPEPALGAEEQARVGELAMRSFKTFVDAWILAPEVNVLSFEEVRENVFAPWGLTPGLPEMEERIEPEIEEVNVLPEGSQGNE